MLKYFLDIKFVLCVVLLICITFLGGCGKEDNSRPNIIVFLADDMGFSDIGSYGAEVIKTPYLDQLAADGLRFTQFYNAARCSPTRASLLTGKYPHQSGMGWLAGPETGFSGYQGHLNESQTIAEALGSNGYKTMMVGKWHVGNPKSGMMPTKRGFDRYFGRPVRADYWDPTDLKLDGNSFEWTGDDFFMTEALAEYATRFIGEHEQQDTNKPFFMYFAFNAPHWPLHARDSDIDHYRGKFMEGWDILRKKRFRNMVEQGIIDSDQQMPPREPAILAWDTISKEKQQAWDLKMATYAAQVTAMDEAIGKVLKKLEKEGQKENTMVLFLSDNGASAESIGRHESKTHHQDGIPPGGPDTHQSYLMPWAHLSNTPFRFYKHWVHEGGIATPFIARWPDVITEQGTTVDAPGHVMDVMATVLDAAGTTYTDTAPSDGASLEGESLVPIFEGKNWNNGRRIFWEHEGHRAVRDGKWKLVSAHDFDDWFYQKWGYPRNPSAQWELYNLNEDRLEQNNLAETYPGKRDELIDAYRQWAEKVGVVDWNKVRPKIPLFNN